MSRDQRKQIIAKMRVSLKQREMSEGEAAMFWRTFLDETSDIDLLTYEQASRRAIRNCEWFPTVAEFRAHAKAVRELAGPTREDLIEQQKQDLLPPPKWTHDGLKNAERALESMPESSPFRAALQRVYDQKARELG